MQKGYIFGSSVLYIFLCDLTFRGPDEHCYTKLYEYEALYET